MCCPLPKNNVPFNNLPCRYHTSSLHQMETRAMSTVGVWFSNRFTVQGKTRLAFKPSLLTSIAIPSSFQSHQAPIWPNPDQELALHVPQTNSTLLQNKISIFFLARQMCPYFPCKQQNLTGVAARGETCKPWKSISVQFRTTDSDKRAKEKQKQSFQLQLTTSSQYGIWCL